MKKFFKEIGWWIDGKLRSLCGEITPDKRLTVILIMLLLFTILNLYFTFTTISDWGREQERREQLKIEHIEQLQLKKTKPSEFNFEFMDSEIDSLILDSTNIGKTELYGE